MFNSLKLGRAEVLKKGTSNRAVLQDEVVASLNLKGMVSRPKLVNFARSWPQEKNS